MILQNRLDKATKILQLSDVRFGLPCCTAIQINQCSKTSKQVFLFISKHFDVSSEEIRNFRSKSVISTRPTKEIKILIITLDRYLAKVLMTRTAEPEGHCPPPLDFGRSVKPITTRRSRLYPHHYLIHQTETELVFVSHQSRG